MVDGKRLSSCLNTKGLTCLIGYNIVVNRSLCSRNSHKQSKLMFLAQKRPSFIAQRMLPIHCWIKILSSTCSDHTCRPSSYTHSAYFSPCGFPAASYWAVPCASGKGLHTSEPPLPLASQPFLGRPTSSQPASSPFDSGR